MSFLLLSGRHFLTQQFVPELFRSSEVTSTSFHDLILYIIINRIFCSWLRFFRCFFFKQLRQMSGKCGPHLSPDITDHHNHHKSFHTAANDLRYWLCLKYIHRVPLISIIKEIVITYELIRIYGWNQLLQSVKTGISFTSHSINLNVVSISGTENVQPIFLFSTHVLWSTCRVTLLTTA